MVGRMILHPPHGDGAWRTKRPTQSRTSHRSARMAQPTRQVLLIDDAAFASCGARTSVRSIQQASKNPGHCTPSSNTTLMVGLMILHPPPGDGAWRTKRPTQLCHSSERAYGAAYSPRFGIQLCCVCLRWSADFSPQHSSTAGRSARAPFIFKPELRVHA